MDKLERYATIGAFLMKLAMNLLVLLVCLKLLYIIATNHFHINFCFEIPAVAGDK